MSKEVLRDAAKHFECKKISKEEWDVYMKERNLSDIEHGDYLDFAYQSASDDRMEALMADVLEALKSVKFIKLGDTEERQKECREANSDVVTALTKLIEKHDVPAKLVENVRSEIGRLFEGLVGMAVSTCLARMGDATDHIVRDRLGIDEVTSGALAKYTEEVFKAAEDAKKEKK